MYLVYRPNKHMLPEPVMHANMYDTSSPTQVHHCRPTMLKCIRTLASSSSSSAMTALRSVRASSALLDANSKDTLDSCVSVRCSCPGGSTARSVLVCNIMGEVQRYKSRSRAGNADESQAEMQQRAMLCMCKSESTWLRQCVGVHAHMLSFHVCICVDFIDFILIWACKYLECP